MQAKLTNDRYLTPTRRKQSQSPLSCQVRTLGMIILAPIGIKPVVGIIDEYLRSRVGFGDEGFYTFHWDALIITAEMGDGRAFRGLVSEHGWDQATIISSCRRKVIALPRERPCD